MKIEMEVWERKGKEVQEKKIKRKGDESQRKNKKWEGQFNKEGRKSNLKEKVK